MIEVGNTSLLPKHEFAYLILSHGKSDQLLRLIRSIRAGSPDSAIVVHHDAKSPPLDQSALNELGGVYHVEPRIDVQWGDASLVDALLQSITYARAKLDPTWISVISGQDYPLRPLATIESELRATHFDAFVKAAPVSTGPYGVRYFLNYHPLPRFPYTYRLPCWLRSAFNLARNALNRHQSYFRIEGGPRGTPLRFGIRAVRHPFRNNFICYKGSGWFTLSSRAADYLIAFSRAKPEVLRYFRNTFIPDESYFQTILCNSKELTISYDHRRFIAWDVSRLAHPKTLTVKDLDAMTQSGKDFGRKFDPAVDSTVLDELDRRLHSPGQG